MHPGRKAVPAALEIDQRTVRRLRVARDTVGGAFRFLEVDQALEDTYHAVLAARHEVHVLRGVLDEKPIGLREEDRADDIDRNSIRGDRESSHVGEALADRTEGEAALECPLGTCPA